MCVCVCVRPPSVSNTTSPVEEFPGIFSRKSKVSRNAAKKLYDVSYMIYGREEEEEEGKREEGSVMGKIRRKGSEGRKRKFSIG